MIISRLIDSMRRELSGPFASKLNATTLNSLLDAESDWLFMEGETSTTEEMEKRWDTLQNRLKEEYKEYYEAKEAHRLEVEKQLEEESKKHEKVGKFEMMIIIFQSFSIIFNHFSIIFRIRRKM